MSALGPSKSLQVESLEERVVMTAGATSLPIGNVSAYISQGVLELRGDSLNNTVDITQLSDGKFQITGSQGTLINNRSTPTVLASVLNINAQLRDGNDSVTVNLQDNRAMRDITINMGMGQSEKVVVKGGQSINNLNVHARGLNALDLNTDGKSLKVIGLTNVVGGNSTTKGDQINLLGTFNTVNIETGDGNDFVQLGKKCTCVTNVRFSATKATVKLGNGNDELNLFKAKVDDFFADLSAGNDSLALSIAQFSATPAKARLLGGIGTDTVKEQTTVSGSPSLSSF
jgi:hypothetical protein